MLGLVLFIEPYSFYFNTLLDAIVAGANAVLAFLTFLYSFDIIVPELVSTIISIIALIVPLVSFFFFCCCWISLLDERTYSPLDCFDQNGEKIEGIIEDHQIPYHLEWFGSLENAISTEEPKKGQVMNDLVLEEPLYMSSKEMSTKLKKMLESVDRILDASTSRKIHFIMKSSSLVAIFGVGYFFGAVYAKMKSPIISC